MKTCDLIGRDLDVAVARAIGVECSLKSGVAMTYDCPFDTGPSESADGDVFEPSQRWGHGGPVIEMEGIDIWQWIGPDGVYWAATVGGREVGTEPHAIGPTPLVAAMRALVRYTTDNLRASADSERSVA